MQTVSLGLPSMGKPLTNFFENNDLSIFLFMQTASLGLPPMGKPLAQVERQFSCIKRILGDWRLSLKTTTIEDLLRICSQGSEPEVFNPTPAVARWWSSGFKRPQTKPYGPRSTKEVAPSTDDPYSSDSQSETDDASIYTSASPSESEEDSPP